MLQIIGFVFVFICLFVWDASNQSKIYKLWAECHDLMNKLQTNNPSQYSKMNNLYGKDMDIIGNRTPENFPISLFVNLRELGKLNYMKRRFNDALDDYDS